VTITNRVSLKSVMSGNTPIADVVDAPTIGAATAGLESATVAYTAATTGGTATSFTAISTPGSVTGTGASPITVSGLTGGTAYTFKVYGTNASGAWSGVQSAASSSVTPTTTAFDSIATFSPTTGTSVTFTSIPQTYKSLQVRAFVKNSSGVANVIARPNSNATSIYKWRNLRGNGTTLTTSNSGSSADNVRLGSFDDTYGGVFILDIHDYASTTLNKTLRASSGYNASGTTELGTSGGSMYSTSAITSLQILNESANFAAGTVIALYGIN
jgi:hypothetical protein